MISLRDRLDRLVLLELLSSDYQKLAELHSHEGTYRGAITAENELLAKLTAIADNFLKDAISFDEAQQQAKAALETNLAAVLEIVESKIEQPPVGYLITRLSARLPALLDDFGRMLQEAEHEEAAIANRISMLAHQATWRTLNQGITITLQIQPPITFDGTLIWTTADDERVCEECEENEGEYGIEQIDELPDIPVHPFCRCFWDF